VDPLDWAGLAAATAGAALLYTLSHRARRDGGAAGADLPAARRGSAADGAGTVLLFFAFAYAATLVPQVATIGVPATTWLSAGILIPFAFIGALAGRPLGERVGADAFAILAILLRGAAGLNTLAAAVGLTVH